MFWLSGLMKDFSAWKTWLAGWLAWLVGWPVLTLFNACVLSSTQMVSQKSAEAPLTSWSSISHHDHYIKCYWSSHCMIAIWSPRRSPSLGKKSSPTIILIKSMYFWSRNQPLIPFSHNLSLMWQLSEITLQGETSRLITCVHRSGQNDFWKNSHS